MAGWKFYVCVSVMVAAIASGAAAFQCYECSACNDPFDSSSAATTDCSTSCLKYKLKSGVVQRLCSPKRSLGDECESTDEGDGCSCTSNLCNSAPIHGISIICLFSITIATLVLKN